MEGLNVHYNKDNGYQRVLIFFCTYYLLPLCSIHRKKDKHAFTCYFYFQNRFMSGYYGNTIPLLLTSSCSFFASASSFGSLSASSHTRWVWKEGKEGVRRGGRKGRREEGRREGRKEGGKEGKREERKEGGKIQYNEMKGEKG